MKTFSDFLRTTTAHILCAGNISATHQKDSYSLPLYSTRSTPATQQGVCFLFFFCCKMLIAESSERSPSVGCSVGCSDAACSSRRATEEYLAMPQRSNIQPAPRSATHWKRTVGPEGCACDRFRSNHTVMNSVIASKSVSAEQKRCEG